MLKKILLMLTLCLFVLIPASAIKRIEANPINVAFILAEDTDTAKMNSTLRYYGYEPSASNDGYTTYKHKNSNVIKYTFEDATEGQPYPKIEVKSKLSSKEIDATLTDLKFEKKGSSYIKKASQYARSVFSCRHASQGFLVFQKSKIPKIEK